MAGLAGLAENYFSNLNPIASRIHSDILETRNAYEHLWDTFNDTEKAEIVDECIIKPEIALKYAFLDPLDIDLDARGFNKTDILTYFDVPCGKKVIHDGTTKFRDEHSSPFSFHTKSQLDLCSFSEKRAIRNPRPNNKPTTPPILKSELAISHSKVLSELKTALKTNESKFESLESKDKQQEFSLKPSKVVEESNSSGGLISKLMGNKKLKSGNAEEREHLVSPSRQCQIVASSDNFFKTNFHSSNAGTTAESHSNVKDMNSQNIAKSMPAYKSMSGLEEARALLTSTGMGDSLAASTDSEFLSCEENTSNVGSLASPCGDLPKTGLDFLDNW